MLACAGALPAAADGAPGGGDVHIAQTLGSRELTVVIRRVADVPGPVQVDVVAHAGTAPGALALAVTPGNGTSTPADTTTLVLGQAPGPYSGTMRVDQVGPWELAISDGRRTARIPFLVKPVVSSPAEQAAYAGFFAAGALLLVALGVAVRSRRSWPALIPGGAMVAAIAVSTTGAVLSGSTPPPPQPGLHLDPTVANMTNPYAGLQPPITDFSRPAAVLTLRSAPLRVGRPADVTLQLSDGATGHPVDDLLVHDDALIHLVVVGPSGQLWHLHPIRTGPAVYQAHLVPPEPGHYAVSAELARRGGGDQLLRSPTGLDVAQGDATAPTGPQAVPGDAAAPAPGLGERVVAGIPVRLAASPLSAGTPATITAQVGDSADLQPWLGMLGHMIVTGPLDDGPVTSTAAEKAQVWAHVHSMTSAGMAAINNPGAFGGQPDETVAGYGPQVPFTYTFPLPGRYRLWIQVERDYSILTIPVVLDVPATPGGTS
ncbi:hypothetical protein DQ384_27545 [Sphaerisporangium album]|uniref:Secreted protein n=1 Tax=Sphaerisporangium album TaxID=509200 RepID=A0A367FA19_9ACTN|nr:hypothetical protein DQ384_27545 [Sphaerisporangium album]